MDPARTRQGAARQLAADICSPDDQADWHPDNPAGDRYDITVLIVNDVFGGDLLAGEVHLNGNHRGFR
ncbi:MULTISPECIES: hypothetical protein [Streptomyces]|uniref:Uncharacterized protein n=1 Tax=Streptomyces yunnanensis TaxID=156453 RepID=A0ABY8AJH6_9ACTN|nr:MULTISPECIES: hypothetical protein [Streptomyces]AJC61525.1 hypothetical protein GZL_09002 [Streptomyces sp. 769]WEB45188.1 hypothetical protein MOV08_41800 [Streptomyces yunnanensis]